jgi:hypothetical protein
MLYLHSDVLHQNSSFMVADPRGIFTRFPILLVNAKGNQAPHNALIEK